MGPDHPQIEVYTESKHGIAFAANRTRFEPLMEKKDWVPIGEGSENWPEILKACEEVGYHTWATAELGKCKEKELMEISRKMDKILELN